MEVRSAFAQPSASIGATNAPADSSRAAADLRTKILNQILAQTRPAPLPKPWTFLGPEKSARQLCVEPAELLASLQGEFSIEHLVDARVIERTSDNELRLSPVFGDTSSSFVIRCDAANSPIDAISSRGLLSSAAPDWLAQAAERADSFTKHQQPMLLAFSDVEVLLLHQLGCEFTSAAKLEQLSGHDVRELFTARARGRCQRRYNLTLQGWQLAECINEPAPNMLRALEQIVKIETVFPVDPASVFDVWLPSIEDRRAIRNALSFRDLKAVRKLLVGSLVKSRFTPAGALSVIRSRTEIDFGTARRNLVRTIGRSDVVPRCGEVGDDLARFGKAFCTTVTKKFVDLGAAINDPLESLRVLMGQDLANAWFESLEEVAAGEKTSSANIRIAVVPTGGLKSGCGWWTGWRSSTHADRPGNRIELDIYIWSRNLRGHEEYMAPGVANTRR